MSDGTRVFVHNLPFGTERPEVEDLFAKAGKIIDVDIFRSQDGRSRGMCTITFEKAEDAE